MFTQENIVFIMYQSNIMHDCLLAGSCTSISMFYPVGGKGPIGVHIVKLYVQTRSLMMLLVLVLVMFSVFSLKLCSVY